MANATATRPERGGTREWEVAASERPRPRLHQEFAVPDKSGPVFASQTGGRLSHRNVGRRGFDAAAEDAGIEGVTLHAFATPTARGWPRSD